MTATLNDGERLDDSYIAKTIVRCDANPAMAGPAPSSKLPI